MWHTISRNFHFIISILKNHIKRLKNIDFPSELHFYEELNVLKTNHEFTGYAMS